MQDTRLGVNLGNNGYSYDAMGRIVANTYTAKDGSSNYRTYTYDEFGQLVRENNEALDKTFVYEYNNIGNVTKVKEYDFTLNTTPTGVLRERNYSYDSASPDKLAAVNGNAIQYNSLGCPVRCGDKVLVWDKGRLMRVYDDVDTSFGYSAEDVRFTYDGQGRRLTKTYTYDPGEDYSGDFCIGRDTAYTYDGDGRLIREHTTEYYTESASTTRELIFLYDEGGIVGVTYSFNGATPVTYYYHKNLQGDVIAIYDEGGNIKAGYAYDAWGNHVVTNSNLPQLAQCNPFRYRGYYYDVETGLYYCNARYYSPKLCRWISPDSIGYLDPSSINGLNLYAYCGNDPVNKYDPTGHSAILIGLIICAVIGFGTAAYIDYQDDGQVFNGSVEWYDYLGATVLGGAIGAGIGYIAPQIAGALSSFAAQQFTFGAGAYLSASGELVMSAGLTITGAQVLTGIGALAGLGIMYIIPKHGAPNSKITDGGSFGEYDSNGNLSYRVDTTGRPHFIKSIGKYCLPHMHKFTWKLVNGVWRFIEEVLPYIL